MSDAGDKQLHSMKNSTMEKVEPGSQPSQEVYSRHGGRISIALMLMSQFPPATIDRDTFLAWYFHQETFAGE